MLLIASLLLACFPPGFLFPQMAARMATGSGSKSRFRRKKNSEKSPATPGGLESGRDAETTDS